MSMRAENVCTFRTDCPVAQSSSFGGATYDSYVFWHAFILQLLTIALDVRSGSLRDNLTSSLA